VRFLVFPAASVGAMMEAASTCEIPANFCHTTQCNIPEDKSSSSNNYCFSSEKKQDRSKYIGEK
jgi:hypothetical protein